MGDLKFKIKKYNMGGYLRYDDGGVFDQYLSDPTVQRAMGRNTQSDQIAGTVSKAASFIPGVGPLLGAGLQLGQTIGKATKDEFGIYKSTGAEILDDVVDPSRWASLIGGGPSQNELKKAKDFAQKKQFANQFDQNEIAGAKSRAAISGFQAAPYGKKGMKFRSQTKFSMAAHR